MNGQELNASAARRELIAREFGRRFGGEPALWVRAPGRVDLMGSHTDYNLGYVMTMTLDRDTWLAVRPRRDRQVAVQSLDVAGAAVFSLDAVDHDDQAPWSNYVRGMAWALQEAGYRLAGFDGLIHSTIPFGSGLSSSAALEMAAGVAFQGSVGHRPGPGADGDPGAAGGKPVCRRELRHPGPVQLRAGRGGQRGAARLPGPVPHHRTDRAGHRGRHLRHPRAAPPGGHGVRRAPGAVRGGRGDPAAPRPAGDRAAGRHLRNAGPLPRRDVAGRRAPLPVHRRGERARAGAGARVASRRPAAAGGAVFRLLRRRARPVRNRRTVHGRDDGRDAGRAGRDRRAPGGRGLRRLHGGAGGAGGCGRVLGCGEGPVRVAEPGSRRTYTPSRPRRARGWCSRQPAKGQPWLPMPASS